MTPQAQLQYDKLFRETELLTRALDTLRVSDGTGGRSKYLESTVRLLGGYGQLGAKDRPFKQEQAPRWFGSIVYALTMLNANAFASVPLRLYVRDKSGAQKAFATRKVSKVGKAWLRGTKHRNIKHAPSKFVQQKVATFGDEYEEVIDTHPALEVLSQVNQWQNGFDLSVLRFIQYWIGGNAYLYPVMSQTLRRPMELWVAPFQFMKVMPGTNGRYIDGYQYGTASDIRTFGPDEIIQFKLASIHPMDFYGMGKVEAAWSAINLFAAQRIQSQAMYDNGARPDYAVIFKDGANNPDMDRVQAAMDGKFRGAGRAGQGLTVSGNVDIKPLNWSPKEMSPDEGVICEICNIFGVPESKYNANDPNRANAETADMAWLRDTILPVCRYDEEQLNAKYLPLFEDMESEDAFLAYDDPVPENESETQTLLLGKLAAGVIDRNEARVAMGDDEAPDNFVVVPMGAVKVGDDGHIEIPEPVDPNADTGKEPGTTKAVKDAKRALAAAGAILLGWRPIAGFALAPALAVIFARQRAVALESLSAQLKTDPTQQPKPPGLNPYLGLIVGATLPHLIASYKAGWTRAAGQLGATAPEIDLPPVTSIITAQAREMATQINATTMRRVEDGLRIAWEVHDHKPTLDEAREAVATVISDVFDDATENRAAVIAENESLEAETTGMKDLARVSGVTYRAFWRLGDSPCPVCVAIAQSYPVGLVGSTDFRNPVNGASVSPPQHPRCQCVLEYTKVSK